jgi:hypothetical protein
MKAFLITLVLIAIAVAIYWSYDKGYFDSLTGGDDQASPPAAATAEETREAHSAAPPTAQPSAPTPPAVDPLDAELAELYPLPAFQPVDQLLAGWTQFPPSVFPREIKLTQAVTRQLRRPDGTTIGSSALPAGQLLFALGNQGSNLIVALSENAAPTDQFFAAIEATDLKQRLTQTYEEWKGRVTRDVLARRDSERSRRATQVAAQQLATPAGAPRPAPVAIISSATPDDPRFKVVADAVRSGRYVDIKADRVQRWRYTGPESFRGISYPDTVTVNFLNDSIFGPIPAEARAYIQGGRIEHFIFTGSEEPVQ